MWLERLGKIRARYVPAEPGCLPITWRFQLSTVRCFIGLRTSLACSHLCAILFLAGCSTHAHRLATPRESFYGNNLPAAREQLQKLNEKPKHDASVIELDLAMVELLSGDLQNAERRLREIRDTWDHLEQKSLGEGATSLLTDDQKIAYSGEDYEKLLVRVMLTLTSLMGDGIDAESYSLQTLAKQHDLFESAKVRWNEELEANYCIPPIAPYLRGVLREQTHSNYDDALRFYQQTSELLPETPWLAADLERVQHATHSQPGHGVVYIIGLVGRGPYKVEASARATQNALFWADRLLSAFGKYSVPPTLAPVKIPRIVSPSMPFELLGVQVDGLPVATTMPVTDLHQLATQSFAEKESEVIARAVARRVIKKGAVYAAKDSLAVTSDLASIAMDAAGVLWEATESADTRCWGLLPREIQILRLELPAGLHELQLEPVTGGVPIAGSTVTEVSVMDGANTYVLSYWPHLQPIGEILVSR